MDLVPRYVWVTVDLVPYYGTADLVPHYTVAKTIGNRSDRRKITLFITDISATYNCISSYLSEAKILVVDN